MNERVLGYAKDYTMQENVPTIEELQEQEKIKEIREQAL